MPRPRKSKNPNRAALLSELTLALDEVDSLKRDLRKAKGRVSKVMGKLDLHVMTARARRKG